MQVKTNVGALFTGAVLAGCLAVAFLGDGRPVIDPPHTPPGAAPPAGGASVGPLERSSAIPEFHPVKVGPDGRILPDASDLQPPPPPPPTTKDVAPSLDRFVLEGGRVAIVYLALFLVAHFALRRYRLIKPWAYAAAGSASLFIALAGQTPRLGWHNLVVGGQVSFYLTALAIAGAILGFIYRWRAGLEAGQDDPNALAQALDNLARVPAVEAGERIDQSLVRTAGEEYFKGPLVVRTSLPIMVVAALVALGVCTLGLFGIVHASRLAFQLHNQLPFLASAEGTSSIQLTLLVACFAIFTIPLSFLVFLIHLLLRALNQSSYLAYGAAGLLSPILLALLAGPLAAIAALQSTLAVVIALCVYRSMAGLEPKPVKEDIVVRDRRNLVPEGHARRAYGRLIDG